MKNKLLQRLLSAALALCLMAAWVLPARAADGSHLTKVSDDRISASLLGRDPVGKADMEPDYADTDIVRVSIVLDDAGTLDAGYSPVNIAKNTAAMSYRDNLKAQQDTMSGKISKAIGQKLDVVWNMTLAANMISANVPYGKIPAIKSLNGIKNVVLETVYEIDIVSKGGDNPNMATSGTQIGSSAAYAAGLTGAGSRIAIIDTGLDVDHISFNANAYMYALLLQAQREGMGLNEYLNKLDLLDAEEIAAVLPSLNMAERMGEELTAADLFVNEKVAFGFNYVDENTNIVHLYDTQGEHGSHVAGIAAANAYIPGEDGFANALEEVLVQGVAPNAQLMVMKVFGANGGAYDSDYMVAIEDAILLGADAINLSLGSAAPGMGNTSNEEYGAILDNLQGSGVVVSISAGNSSHWSAMEEGSGYGLLYLDDVSQHTSGSPGSFTNSLGVASVDNAGYTQLYLRVNDTYLTYLESTDYGNAPITTVGGTHEYVFLNGIGTPEQFAALDAVVDLQDKVVLCYRGETSFFEKANAAVAMGAKAVIIVNNQPGLLGLNLTGYEYTAPVVALTLDDGEYFKDQPIAGEGVEGWTGTVEISSKPAAIMGNSGSYIMSEFSSWGVPGSLTLKPEITAPGGSIYSVGGAWFDGEQYYFTDNASYEQMSGTSMAAPQIAGMAALMAQFIREHGLDQQTGLDARTLAQSLLMSTAVPVLDGTNGGYYYPVIQQGAGLANVGDAIMADSYILMGADATASYADGKVKAELGDDPARTGIYSFSFTIHNLTDVETEYALYSDIFTQAPISDGYAMYMALQTVPLLHTAQWTVNGEASDGTATVPANGSAEVKVTITLDAGDMEFLNYYYDNGAYVEGYVYAQSAATAEGEMGTCHSIPVLGFYGSWADPSMYDKGSYEDYYLSGEETRAPYLYGTNFAYGDMNTLFLGNMYGGEEYYYGGNLYVNDAEYKPERNALSAVNGDMISGIGFTTIRNAGAAFVMIRNADTGELLVLDPVGTDIPAAYFGTNSGSWQNTYYSLNVGYVPEGIEENTRIEVGMLMVPEYYIDAEGNIDPAAITDGTVFSMEMTVDNTEPEIADYAVDGTTLTVNASDNQYIAAIMLLDSMGEQILSYCGSDPNAKAGQTSSFMLDITGVNTAGFYLGVYDYAGNLSVYFIEDHLGEVTEVIDHVAVTPESMVMNVGTVDRVTASVAPVNAVDRTYTWSSSDENVAIVLEDGTVVAVGEGTAMITATANGDPTKTGSCQVTVLDIQETLNAVVWDENGSIYVSEFSTETMPEYTKLSGDLLETDYIASMTVAPNGTIYAASLDTNSLSSNIYTVDPHTWEFTYLSSTPYGLTDMTFAPAMFGYGAILGTYGGNVIAYEPMSGQMWAFPDFFADTMLVGITSVYSGFNEDYGLYEDHIVYIDSEGNVYYEIYLSMIHPETGEALVMCATADEEGNHMPYMSTGVSKSGAMYFNSAYYQPDTGLVYWSAFDQTADNAVTLYAIDLVQGLTVNVGSFADSVWPVGGLFEMPCLHEHTELTGVVAADCVTPGYTGDVYCTDCGSLVQYGEWTQIDPSNHAMGEWQETKPATCTEPGEETSHCTREGCEHFETRETALAEHHFDNGFCVDCGAIDRMLGDINGDGRINVLDAGLIVSYYTGERTMEEIELVAADVNGDGKVNVLDAGLIVSYYTGTIDEFPKAE